MLPCGVETRQQVGLRGGRPLQRRVGASNYLVRRLFDGLEVQIRARVVRSVEGEGLGVGVDVIGGRMRSREVREGPET